jgi:phosphoribosyl 1,2-cyclic phosphodiesterase
MTEIRLTFWGTRGSLPCSGPQYTTYGGNTCCVELTCGEHVVVFDAGSGIRGLGEHLAHHMPRRIDMLLSHYHFDHICGLPFFAPFFHPGIDVTIHAGQSDDWLKSSDMLDSFMKPPFFPITPSTFRAELGFRDFHAGDGFTLESGLEVATAPLIHPQGATGYRIDHDGRRIAYVTDTEMTDTGPTPAMLALVADADILVLDAMFTEQELGMCRGWGHSSWRQGIEFADAANVGTLFLFHHHPLHDDDMMDAIAEAADAARPGTRVAREGETVTL